MIRVTISAIAYHTLAATMPGMALKRPQEAPGGGFFLWLDNVTRNRLNAARARGEGWSETIIRLAQTEAEL
jgi:hypothetical protein